ENEIALDHFCDRRESWQTPGIISRQGEIGKERNAGDIPLALIRRMDLWSRCPLRITLLENVPHLLLHGAQGKSTGAPGIPCAEHVAERFGEHRALAVWSTPGGEM